VYFYDIFKNLIMKTKEILLVGAGATIIYLLWKRSTKAKDSKGLVGTIGGTLPNIQEGKPADVTIKALPPDKIYPLELPPNMDLPNLTKGTGVDTEIAIQQGGVLTTPTPIISDGYTTCEQRLNNYAKTIKLSTQQEYDVMKANYLNTCEGKLTTTQISDPTKVFGVSHDVLPVSADEYLNNTLKGTGRDLGIERASLSANGMNTRGRVINGTLFRGVM
jgi:hypothetical protein